MPQSADIHQIDDYFDFSDDPAGVTPGLNDGPLPVPPRLGLLADLTREQFDVVARSAKLTHVEPGTVVFHQGDAADRFFIVVDGEVCIERDGVELGTLGHSSFFGETALLTGGLRSANVTAIGAVSLWSVDYATFQAVVSDQLLGREDVRSEVEARLASTPLDRFTS